MSIWVLSLFVGAQLNVLAVSYVFLLGVKTLYTHSHTHTCTCETFATLPECCLCFDCVFALHIMSIMSLAVPNTKSDSIEN